MKIKANGIQFNCLIEGDEQSPWLIFSNSLATNLSMWDAQATHFSKSFRILRYDQRGHGKSDAPSGPYPIDMLLNDAISLMNALDVKRAHFCGLSLGGTTAMGLAQKYPDRFDRVIVCDTPCASTAAAAKQWEERVVIAKRDGMAALAESTLERWFPAEVLVANPPRVEVVRNMILSTPVNGFAGCAAALADHDYRSAVKTVSRPVLFLVGEKDAPNAAMRAMHAELLGSQFQELPDSGHISNLDQPALFTKAVADFLQ